MTTRGIGLAAAALCLAACSDDDGRPSLLRAAADWNFAEDIAKDVMGGCPVAPPAIGLCAGGVIPVRRSELTGDRRIERSGARTTLSLPLRAGGEMAIEIEDGVIVAIARRE